MSAPEDLYELARGEVEDALAEQPADEEALVGVLDVIGARAADDLAELAEAGLVEEQAWEALAAVEAWASLASYAFQRVYAESPPSVGTPFRRFAGSKKEVMKALDSVCARFQPALENACRVLGALSYSISVGFPWGVSVGIAWEP